MSSKINNIKNGFSFLIIILQDILFMIKKSFFIYFILSMYLNYASAQSSFVEFAESALCADDGQGVGVSVADFNNDGFEDLYITFRSQPDILYKNINGEYFENITSSAGISQLSKSQAAAWGDFDNDGWIDLFVASQNKGKRLYQNNGDETFTERAFEAGVQTETNTTSIALSDIDNDGLLDIYTANLGEENTLYKNNGNWTFTNYVYFYNATDDQISMGIAFFDFDNDKDDDLYLSHDANQAAILYENNGQGFLTNIAGALGVNVAKNGMGLDVGDLNNDGWLDLYLANLGPNNLFINQNGTSFLDRSEESEVDEGGMGWGINIFDYNNDTRQDIFVANDSYFAPFPNVLYTNQGDLQFTKSHDAHELATLAGSYGTAVLDFNNDGKEDLFVCNTHQDRNYFYTNQTDSTNNWIDLQLEGTLTNKTAIGTRVLIEAGDFKTTDQIMSGSGWASQNRLALHFGLGTHEVIDRITIFWPRSENQILENIAVNQILKIKEPEVTQANTIEQNNDWYLFPNPGTDVTRIKGIRDLHSPIKIEIYNSQGKLLDEHNLSSSLEINTSALVAGVYYFKMIQKGEHRVLKYLKL